MEGRERDKSVADIYARRRAGEGGVVRVGSQPFTRGTVRTPQPHSNTTTVTQILSALCIPGESIAAVLDEAVLEALFCILEGSVLESISPACDRLAPR
jgi:hypothetical protein